MEKISKIAAPYYDKPSYIQPHPEQAITLTKKPHKSDKQPRLPNGRFASKIGKRVCPKAGTSDVCIGCMHMHIHKRNFLCNHMCKSVKCIPAKGKK